MSFARTSTQRLPLHNCSSSILNSTRCRTVSKKQRESRERDILSSRSTSKKRSGVIQIPNLNLDSQLNTFEISQKLPQHFSNLPKDLSTQINIQLPKTSKKSLNKLNKENLKAGKSSSKKRSSSKQNDRRSKSLKGKSNPSRNFQQLLPISKSLNMYNNNDLQCLNQLKTLTSSSNLSENQQHHLLQQLTLQLEHSQVQMDCNEKIREVQGCLPKPSEHPLQSLEMADIPELIIPQSQLYLTTTCSNNNQCDNSMEPLVTQKREHYMSLDVSQDKTPEEILTDMSPRTSPHLYEEEDTICAQINQNTYEDSKNICDQNENQISQDLQVLDKEDEEKQGETADNKKHNLYLFSERQYASLATFGQPGAFTNSHPSVKLSVLSPNSEQNNNHGKIQPSYLNDISLKSPPHPQLNSPYQSLILRSSEQKLQKMNSLSRASRLHTLPENPAEDLSMVKSTQQILKKSKKNKVVETYIQKTLERQHFKDQLLSMPVLEQQKLSQTFDRTSLGLSLNSIKQGIHGQESVCILSQTSIQSPTGGMIQFQRGRSKHERDRNAQTMQIKDFNSLQTRKVPKKLSCSSGKGKVVANMHKSNSVMESKRGTFAREVRGLQESRLPKKQKTTFQQRSQSIKPVHNSRHRDCFLTSPHQPSFSNTMRNGSVSQTRRNLTNQSEYYGSKCSQNPLQRRSMSTSRRDSNHHGIPKLSLSQTMKPQNSQTDRSHLFVDLSAKTSHSDPTNQLIRDLQDKLAFIGAKMDHYVSHISHAGVMELKQIRDAQENGRGQGIFKCLRCLCLLMKSFTAMDPTFRQIKDEELFDDWEKITQYLESEQGQNQIRLFPEIKQFCNAQSNLIERQTLLVDMRRKLFSYSIGVEDLKNQIDLESPRVKNIQLKPIFCFAYFTMTYVTIQDRIITYLLQNEAIRAREQQERQSEFQLLDKNQISPDLDCIDVANITIGNTKFTQPVSKEISIQQTEKKSADIFSPKSFLERKQYFQQQSIDHNMIGIDMFGSHFKPLRIDSPKQGSESVQQQLHFQMSSVAPESSSHHTSQQTKQSNHLPQVHRFQDNHNISISSRPSTSFSLHNISMDNHHQRQVHSSMTHHSNSSKLSQSMSKPLKKKVSRQRKLSHNRSLTRSVNNNDQHQYQSTEQQSYVSVGNPKHVMKTPIPTLTQTSKHSRSHQSDFTFYNGSKKKGRQGSRGVKIATTQNSSRCEQANDQDDLFLMQHQPHYQHYESQNNQTFHPNGCGSGETKIAMTSSSFKMSSQMQRENAYEADGVGLFWNPAVGSESCCQPEGSIAYNSNDHFVQGDHEQCRYDPVVQHHGDNEVQPINVEQFIRQIRNEEECWYMQNEQQYRSKGIEEEDDDAEKIFEQAFEKFYNADSQANLTHGTEISQQALHCYELDKDQLFDTVQPIEEQETMSDCDERYGIHYTQRSDEKANMSFEDYNGAVKTNVSIDHNDQYFDKEIEKLLNKSQRTTDEIVNSVKRRRCQSKERILGQSLEELTNQIIQQCQASLISSSTLRPQSCESLNNIHSALDERENFQGEPTTQRVVPLNSNQQEKMMMMYEHPSSDNTSQVQTYLLTDDESALKIQPLSNNDKLVAIKDCDELYKQEENDHFNFTMKDQISYREDHGHDDNEQDYYYY